MTRIRTRHIHPTWHVRFFRDAFVMHTYTYTRTIPVILHHVEDDDIDFILATLRRETSNLRCDETSREARNPGADTSGMSDNLGRCRGRSRINPVDYSWISTRRCGSIFLAAYAPAVEPGYVIGDQEVRLTYQDLSTSEPSGRTLTNTRTCTIVFTKARTQSRVTARRETASLCVN